LDASTQAAATSGGGQRVRVPADEDQVRPGLGEGLGHRPAEPPAAAGDQGRAAVEPEPVEYPHRRPWVTF
jgi:hypothetical protein